MKWPTDLIFHACFSTCKVFKAVMSNSEEDFLISTNQRAVLMHLTLNYLGDAFHSEEIYLCGNSTKHLIVQAVRSITKILLNNYARSVNNEISQANFMRKKRKLSAFHA